MEHYQISDNFFNFYNDCPLSVLPSRLNFINYVLHPLVVHVLNRSSYNYFVIVSSWFQVPVCKVSAFSDLGSLDAFQTWFNVAEPWSWWYLHTCWTSLIAMTFTLLKAHHRPLGTTSTIWHKIGLRNLNSLISLFIRFLKLQIKLIFYLCFQWC